MPFSYREWILGGKTFCCCLPVRFGVIAMSAIGILVAGLLSIVLWFQVSAPAGSMTTGERAAFVVAGLVETILFLASILGFVGSIVHKQSFIQAYAYILYGHFFLNIGAAAYLGYVVIHFQGTATRVACDETITDDDAQAECRGLLRITATVFIVIAAIVLLAELYGAIIVTRWLNFVQRDKREKRMLRESKRATDSAFSLRPLNRSFYGDSRATSSVYLPLNQRDEEFDPYAEVNKSDVRRSVQSQHSRLATDRTLVNNDEDLRPPPPIEVGYGGGSWTHRDISEEEKSRIELAERDSTTVSLADLTEAEKERRRSEIKSPYGPPSASEEDAELESLPQYVATFPEPQHSPPGQPESLLR
ncbi:hypothetical protein EST38_g271 [Candolleomyces aberdarensis]|uniref:Uncharacterized protein n=1 Tax=Candolleomyces aberdarensis TaxID=2316362 RepID=A0A4Q2DZY5_9AGAR|nr:hypothetical protein EST38_g271 [Candolleomyces aberdarensis]